MDGAASPTQDTVSEAALWRALDGVILPLSRSELVRVARENEAPMEAITRLAGLPDRRFHTLEEVRRALTPLEGDVRV